MKELLEKRMNLILLVVVIVAALAIGIPTGFRSCSTSTSNGELATVKPTAATPDEVETTVAQTSVVEATVKVNANKAKKKNATKSTKADTEATEPTEAIVSTEEPTDTKATKATEETTEPKVFATAEKVANKASYDAQWNAGFLVAIDNPDTSYYCPHFELTDKNRDLLERLCMGEFGSGGFAGAAMIAQAVKDDMYYYGYTDVATIISQLHYTGRTDVTPTKSVKDAVTYVFDMDKDAIQHRILYMYNPKLMSEGYSSFHESQRYICNLEDVRFFDR